MLFCAFVNFIGSVIWLFVRFISYLSLFMYISTSPVVFGVVLMYNVLFSIFAVMLLCCFFAVNVVVAVDGAYFLSPGYVTVMWYVPPWTLLIVIVFCPFLRYIVSVWLFIVRLASPATSPSGVSVMFM